MELPVGVKRWVERQIERNLKKTDEVTMWVVQATSKKKRENNLREWERNLTRRKARLARVASKIKKSGFSERMLRW